MRLVVDTGVALCPAALLCGGLWYFKKREAAQIIALQAVADAFACLAQLWLIKKCEPFSLRRSLLNNNDSYIIFRRKALRARIEMALSSGILLAVAAQAVKSERTVSAKQLALPIVAMSVSSLLAGGSYTSSQSCNVQQRMERAVNWAQNLSGVVAIGIICYRRWGFR